jgi:hypothetical protein
MDLIHFPVRIDLGGFKVVKNIGGRELIILLVCIAGTVIFLFSGDSSGLLMRLLIGVPLAAFVFMASLIPIRGYKVERFLLVMLAHQFSPKIFIRQSAQPVNMRVVADQAMETPELKVETPKPKVNLKPQIDVKVPSLSLNLPQVTAFIIVLVFFVITLISSALLYYNR